MFICFEKACVYFAKRFPAMTEGHATGGAVTSPTNPVAIAMFPTKAVQLNKATTSAELFKLRVADVEQPMLSQN